MTLAHYAVDPVCTGWCAISVAIAGALLIWLFILGVLYLKVWRNWGS